MAKLTVEEVKVAPVKKYVLELTEFEASVLKRLSTNVGGTGPAREVFSDRKDSLLSLLHEAPNYYGAIKGTIHFNDRE